MERASFLIVDDDSLTARSLDRVLSRFGATQIADSRAEAWLALQRHRTWLGFVVDLRLPDGSGLDVLQSIRASYPLTPAILLSASLENEIINAAFSLSARPLCKPCRSSHLQRFASESVEARQVMPKMLNEAVFSLAARHQLSPAQTEILLAVVGGMDQPTIAARRRVSKNTHKTQVRGILKKTSTESLRQLREQVLRSVVGTA